MGLLLMSEGKERRVRKEEKKVERVSPRTRKRRRTRLEGRNGQVSGLVELRQPKPKQCNTTKAGQKGWQVNHRH